MRQSQDRSPQSPELGSDPCSLKISTGKSTKMSEDPNFLELETIYSLPLSPTIVSLVRDMNSGEVSSLQITNSGLDKEVNLKAQNGKRVAYSL